MSAMRYKKGDSIMTQEEKDLLLKDICSRLPYGVKVQDIYYKSLEPVPIWLIDIHAQNVRMFADEGYQRIEYIKPYLFPLSSMTEEQRLEYAHILVMCSNLANCQLLGMTVEDWFNKNHFAHRGIIPMGLAIDATGLNIY
jgi:hypothetical protein